jgi:hypothetical protein
MLIDSYLSPIPIQALTNVVVIGHHNIERPIPFLEMGYPKYNLSSTNMMSPTFSNFNINMIP